MKGPVSAQKAVQGSETETRELLGGTEENSVSPLRDHLPSRQINDFLRKGNRKKLSKWPDLGGGVDHLIQPDHVGVLNQFHQVDLLQHLELIGEREEVVNHQSPPNFWSNKNKCAFNKRTLKVCISSLFIFSISDRANKMQDHF